MALTKDELSDVAQHFITASKHYKRIGRMLTKAHDLVNLFDGTGNPLVDDQVNDLMADLVAEKALGDAAIASAEAGIAD